MILDVNGDKVYRSELESAVRSMPANMQGVLSTDIGKRAIADEIIRLKLLEQEGRRLDVVRDPEVARQIDMETAKIIASAALRRLAVAEENDPELQKLYEEAKPRLNMVQTRQIVIAYAGGALKPKEGEALSEAAAMQRAQKLRARLDKGEDFGSLALAESDDVRSAQTGGAINVLPGQAPAEIETALFSMKPDEIRGPIKSPIGIHLFQLLNRQTRSFDEVKPILMQELRKRKIDRVVDELKKKANVQLDPEYFGPEPKKKDAQ